MATKDKAEEWKTVNFDFEFNGKYRLQVSNLGRLRAYNKFSAGKILKGSIINGYHNIRVVLFKPKDKKTIAALTAKRHELLLLRAIIDDCKRTLSQLSTEDLETEDIENQIIDNTKTLKIMRAALKQAREQDIKNRCINYHSPVHRLVAEYFCIPKSSRHTVICHLDYDKLNNKANNLKWMTPEENYKHNKKNPAIIEEKKRPVKLKKVRAESPKVYKWRDKVFK